jgi:aspartate aminotransferase
MLGMSKRVAALTTPATFQLTAKLAEMASEGVEVIKFNLGEPDFDTPRNIIDACKNALDEGKTRYTAAPGILEVREAIAEKLEKENGVKYSPAEISFGAGAKQPLFNALFVLIDTDDEVIIPTPCYVSYIDMVKLCGGNPVLVPCDEASGFALDVRAIRGAVTERTKAIIIINTPNNPTGTVYSEAALRDLVSATLEKKFYILSDEVYVRRAAEIHHESAQ